MIATVVGFGARLNVKPRYFLALLVLATGGLVLLGPVGRIQRVVVSLSFMTYLTWWLMSYLWTASPGWWFNEAQVMVPVSVLLTVIVTAPPTDRFIQGILVGAYVGMGYTTFYTVTHPGLAMSHYDGTPGWSGSFGHKNGLAPFMLYATFVVLAFEQDRRKRRIAPRGRLDHDRDVLVDHDVHRRRVLLPFAHFLLDHRRRSAGGARHTPARRFPGGAGSGWRVRHLHATAAERGRQGSDADRTHRDLGGCGPRC